MKYIKTLKILREFDVELLTRDKSLFVRLS